MSRIRTNHRSFSFPDPVVLSAPSGKEDAGSIAIFGPGLIGGSVAMALRKHSPRTFITVCGRDVAQLQEITKRKLADAVQIDPIAAVVDADIVVFCTPVEAMEGLAAAVAPHLLPRTVVTDAGSVKVCVTEKLVPILGSRFVGGHPMAGSERSGIGAARADLFSGAPCILTPIDSTDSNALQRVTAFWSSLGARITNMSPADHDRIVACLSHLPHVVAFALVDLARSSLPEGSVQLAGGSFRDATRVAASDPKLWTGILMENRHEVVLALRGMSELLGSIAASLNENDAEDLLGFLKCAGGFRGTLPLPEGGSEKTS